MHDSFPANADVPHTWAESDRFMPRSFVQPLQRFMDTEASGAIVMLVAAIAGLVWANSPWYHSQETLWDTDLSIQLGGLVQVDLTLAEWINDALMAIFFFVVGLEIKRELVHGELRDPRKAALPAIAAVGGMIVPATIYLVFNAGTDGGDGWGVPMATDIAFAVAVVALVGPRIPSSAKVFLLTLAIADDIGAIAVIAIFYTDRLSFGWLVIALAIIGGLHVAKRLQVRSMPLYVVAALFLWFAVHESGVHATLAGVTLGLMTPAWSFYDPRRFAADARVLVEAAADMVDDEVITPREYALNQARLEDLQRLVAETQSPLERLEHQLQRWVAFIIVPLFAFSNAGVRLTGDTVDGLLTDRVVLGVALGLILGKTTGVFVATVVGARFGLGQLPTGVSYRHVFGLSITAGIGFTVALFVTGLAFEPGSPLIDSAKIGILGGSVFAGLAGYFLLRSTPPMDPGGDGETMTKPEPALADQAPTIGMNP